MVVLIEIQFPGAIHEECNSGMLELFDSFKEEKLIYVAEETQIEAVRKIGIPNRIECIAVEIPDFKKAEKIEFRREYEAILENIVEMLHIKKTDHMVFMSSPKCIFASAIKIHDKYGMQMTFIEHANLEWLQRINMREEEIAFYRETISENRKLNDINFISFSPYAKEGLVGCLGDNILERFYFLHHPVSGNFEKKARKNSKIVIGVYGACINQLFFQILKKLYVKEGYDNIEFLVLNRTTLDKLDYRYIYPSKGVRMHQTCGFFSREKKLKCFEEIDYILLPYDNRSYRVSMSGILADAIRCGIPILSLDTPIIKYYNNIFPLGIVEENMDSLCEKIITSAKVRDEEKYEEYVKNMKQLREQMTEENKVNIRKLFK